MSDAIEIMELREVESNYCGGLLGLYCDGHVDPQEFARAAVEWAAEEEAEIWAVRVDDVQHVRWREEKYCVAEGEECDNAPDCDCCNVFVETAGGGDGEPYTVLKKWEIIPEQCPHCGASHKHNGRHYQDEWVVGSGE